MKSQKIKKASVQQRHYHLSQEAIFRIGKYLNYLA